MEQVRLCAVRPMKDWLGTYRTTLRVGWMMWICYSRALERRPLFRALLFLSHDASVCTHSLTHTMNVLSSAHLSPRGCVNRASWLPLAASVNFAQPHRERYAVQCTGLAKAERFRVEVERFIKIRNRESRFLLPVGEMRNWNRKTIPFQYLLRLIWFKFRFQFL